MTIAISVKVGEGLVYTADSTSTFFDHSGAKPELVQSFHHARKLIQLGGYPIGILTFGLGSIGARNLESLVAEFETTQPPFVDKEGFEFKVEEIGNGLRDFVAAKYNAQFPGPVADPATGISPADARPQLGIIVGGYSKGEFFPDEFALNFPAATVERTRSNPKGDFGAMWWGITHPITRLVLGYDPGLQSWLVDKGVDATQAVDLVGEIREKFQWSTLFDGMPIQDAIDYGMFLANVTIGHSRFVVGPPVCGGSVDVATITHKGFAWVREKKRVVKGDSVFF